MSLTTIKQLLSQGRHYIGLRPTANDETDDSAVPMYAGTSGGVLVEIADGAFGIATAALQVIANTLLGYIAPGNTTALVSTAGAAPTVQFDPGVPFTLIVMTAGIVKVRDNNGNQLTLTTTADGYVHPGLLTKVYVDAANTATGLVAVY